jgi:nucleoid-associated protein YgaU
MAKPNRNQAPYNRDKFEHRSFDHQSESGANQAPPDRTAYGQSDSAYGQTGSSYGQSDLLGEKPLDKKSDSPSGKQPDAPTASPRRLKKPRLGKEAIFAVAGLTALLAVFGFLVHHKMTIQNKNPLESQGQVSAEEGQSPTAQASLFPEDDGSGAFGPGYGDDASEASPPAGMAVSRGEYGSGNAAGSATPYGGSSDAQAYDTGRSHGSAQSSYSSRPNEAEGYAYGTSEPGNSEPGNTGAMDPFAGNAGPAVSAPIGATADNPEAGVAYPIQPYTAAGQYGGSAATETSADGQMPSAGETPRSADPFRTSSNNQQQPTGREDHGDYYDNSADGSEATGQEPSEFIADGGNPDAAPLEPQPFPTEGTISGGSTRRGASGDAYDPTAYDPTANASNGYDPNAGAYATTADGRNADTTGGPLPSEIGAENPGYDAQNVPLDAGVTLENAQPHGHDPFQQQPAAAAAQEYPQTLTPDAEVPLQSGPLQADPIAAPEVQPATHHDEGYYGSSSRGSQHVRPSPASNDGYAPPSASGASGYSNPQAYSQEPIRRSDSDPNDYTQPQGYSKDPQARVLTEPVPDTPPGRDDHFRRVDQPYRITSGDNFWLISRKLYGTTAYFRALQEHNRRKVPRASRLTIGMEISAPSAEVLHQTYPDLCPKRNVANTPARMRAVSAVRNRGGRLYAVIKGDTLYDIAKYELGDPARMGEIFELNRDILADDANHLPVGMELLLPPRVAPNVTRNPGRDPVQHNLR